MKKSWSLLQDLMGTKKSKKEITCILDGEVELTSTDDIVNKFANFFSTVGTNLDLNLVQNDLSPCANVCRNPHSFQLFPVSPDECLKIISKLKCTRTSINQMAVKIFKSVKEFIYLPLMNILNSSFAYSVFPKSMKIAKITPVHKKGDAQICSNYRPISSLPYLSKVMERCMANRIISFFNKHSLFSNKQFGFLSNRSTQDALFDFCENVYDALNAKKHNISILIDLKSAFDTVNHSILLKKLELYGIRGHGLNWIKSYLSDREFFVGLNNVCSTKHTVNIGIPQGSILGPIFFIIYNNDLPLVSTSLSTTLFADDTNFSISSHDYNSMIPALNNELEKIVDWTVANRLTINTSKTELLLFSNRITPHTDSDVYLGGHPVKYVENARFLGVTIDTNMNFKPHINNLVSKVSKHGGKLYKIKDNMPLPARMTYYNSFILPYLSFNILHWGNTNNTHLNPLFISQKRIVRTIADAEYLEHSTPLFYRLKILKLSDLYKFHAVLDTFKKLKCGHYVTCRYNVSSRHGKLALPKFHRLTRTQQSLSFSGPNLWNSLPRDLRDIESYSLFKANLKLYYLNQYLAV